MQVRYTVEALQHPDPGIQEGTLTMVYKIAEDFPYQLQENILFAQDTAAKPTDILMPHIAALFSTSKSDDVRFHALRTFNKLVDLMPEWLVNNMDGYVTGLLALANREKDPRIHRVRRPFHFIHCTSSVLSACCCLTIAVHLFASLHKPH